ncbi:hypothetical protein QUB70_33055, partial [Microcoleus sp. A003_D6]|uniref:hypothetical protein n=1 Tax=Microcoleus sp. A003_D6 TaxID=3055266 RepID=UPI002FD1B41C
IVQIKVHDSKCIVCYIIHHKVRRAENTWHKAPDSRKTRFLGSECDLPCFRSIAIWSGRSHFLIFLMLGDFGVVKGDRPQCDRVLCLLGIDERAIALQQPFWKQLDKVGKK